MPVPGHEEMKQDELILTRWWTRHGTHPNLVIPNAGDPISGSMCWNDTVVTVELDRRG